MADEPTNGELWRLIESVRGDMREDMGQLNTRLDKALLTEVYNIEKGQITDRIAALETARERDAEQVRGTRRWMVGTVITVVVAILPYLGALVRGAGA